MYFGESFGLVLSYYQHKNTLRKKNKEIEVLPGSNKEKRTLLIILFGITFIDLFASIAQEITYIKVLTLLDKARRIVTITLMTILSMLILKYKYYKHHWLGIIVISIYYI